MADTSAHRGEQAFKQLLRDIFASIDQDLESFAPMGGDGSLDTRDYRRVSVMLHAGLVRNLLATEDGHREGFLRALTDIICREAEAMCEGGALDAWHPLRVTERAFSVNMRST